MKSPVTIYRCMRPDAVGAPKIGASLSTLGVRPGKDIPVAADGSVDPQTGGMSVTPDDPDAMPFDLLPRSRGGDGRHPMFSLVVADLPETLVARRDKPDHANVEPATRQSFAAYNGDVQSTQGRWVRTP